MFYSRAQRLAELEVERAKRWEKERKMAMETRAHQIQELTALANHQIAVAKESNRQAVRKAREALDQTATVMKDIDSYRELHHQERVEAVLELKENTAAVFDELRQAADKYRAKQQRKKEQLEQERDSMLARGLNPYVEFRKREFEAEGRSREQRMKQTVEGNKESLKKTLVKEDELQRKQDAIDYQNHVREERSQRLWCRSCVWLCVVVREIISG